MAKKKKDTGGGASAAPTLRLPNAELDVLSCIWRQGAATAREIRECMSKYRPMAHGSVVTLLTRLEAKRLVTKEKGPVGKAFVYKSTKKPDPMYKQLVKDMVNRVFGGDSVAMVSALLEAHQPKADELAELQRLVNSLKGRKR